MKKILSLLFALYLLVPSGFGQDDEIMPKSLGISFFLNDFVTASRIRTTSLSSVLRNKSVAKFSEMTPGIAINYYKGIKRHLDLAASLGGSFIRYPMPSKSFANNNFLLEANASVNFKLTSEKYWFQPYLTAGIGGHKYLGYYGAFMPLGAGFKINLFDEAYILASSTYRVPITTETANYHFQHSIGVLGRLTKKKEPVLLAPPPPPPPADRDGDGIIDTEDKCPDVKGLAKYQGCPVPDTDKDGINDEEDKCPTVAGLARYQGCPVPDTDKDGINDEEDKCPTVAGLARYQGCPVPDTDGDGINDEEDRCPKLKGTAANQGCPEIKPEDKKRVEVAAKNILFVTGKSTLQSKSFKGLNEVVAVMNENPEMLLAIDGHTDSDGSEEMNQKLSDGRAASVKAYLVSKGIDEARITATGHGELEPIATNKTAAGKQQNRRSELTLSYFK